MADVGPLLSFQDSLSSRSERSLGSRVSASLFNLPHLQAQAEAHSRFGSAFPPPPHREGESGKGGRDQRRRPGQGGGVLRKSSTERDSKQAEFGFKVI